MGYLFSSRLIATLNLSLIYFKITWALAILLDHRHKKFEINQTKVKVGCQLGRKVVTHNSKSDLPLSELNLSNIFHPILSVLIGTYLSCDKKSFTLIYEFIELVHQAKARVGLRPRVLSYLVIQLFSFFVFFVHHPQCIIKEDDENRRLKKAF